MTPSPSSSSTPMSAFARAWRVCSRSGIDALSSRVRASLGKPFTSSASISRQNSDHHRQQPALVDSIALPTQPLPVPPSSPGSDMDTTPIRVLLVDDHAVVRMGLRAFFDQLDDIDVVGEASDGSEGVAM